MAAQISDFECGPCQMHGMAREREKENRDDGKIVAARNDGSFDGDRSNRVFGKVDCIGIRRGRQFDTA